MADLVPGGSEGLEDGGSSAPQGYDVANNGVTAVAPLEKRPPGRPRRDGLVPGSEAAAAADLLKRRQRNIERRQRQDVKELARVGGDLLRREDHGAGRTGSPAAAFGTVTRALREIHEMERRQYGMDQEISRPVAVILLPVAASDIGAWQAESVRLLGSQPRSETSMEVRPGYRVIEEDVIGTPADEAAP